MKKFASLLLVIAMLVSVALILPVDSASYVVGDVDGDGRVSSLDVNRMVRAMSGLYRIEDARCADINGDGAFGPVDVNLILRYLVGTYEIEQPDDENEEDNRTLADISLYSVVYPEEATEYEIYSAELLCDYISDHCNITLDAYADNEDESQYEILIGETSRDESVTGSELGDYSYIFMTVDDKIVLKGNGCYVGCGVGDLTYDCIDGNRFVISDIPAEETVRTYNPRDAKNVMLLIGDGMGDNQIDFSLMWAGRASFKNAYEDVAFPNFAAKDMPNYGHCTTYCLSDGTNQNGDYYPRVTDSAAAGTALSCATKTSQGRVGEQPYPLTIHYTNIVELLSGEGVSCGVMSTEPSTGATPAAFSAHTASRANKDDILACQEEMLEDGTLDVLCCDCNDDILYDTITALDTLSDNEDGFFIMIEEAYIDKAMHTLYDNYTREDLTYFVYRFDTFIRYCMTFATCRPDTVVLVTADHETGGLTMMGGVTSAGKHTNTDVPVFAMGKGTEIFNNTTVDNTDIPKFFVSLFGIEDFGTTYDNIDFSILIDYK